MKVNVEITFSKILSILLLIAAVYTSIVLDASEIMILSIPIVGGMIAHKTHTDKQLKIKESEKNNKDLV